MADEDQGSKSEAPSQRKIDQAREHGDVAKSHDVSTWASLAAVVGVVASLGGPYARELAGRLRPFIERPDAYQLQNGGATQLMHEAMSDAAPIVLTVMLSAAAAGVAGNMLQTGFLFVPDKLMPDFSRLSPAKGLERLFGLDGMINFAKSAFKFALVCVVAWMSLHPHMAEFQELQLVDPMSMLPIAAAMLRALFFSVLVMLGVGALLDWFLQRQRFMDRMKMSKQELKDEHRQSEGDPHIKARLRQMRNERSRRRMMQNVAKASVVVMNPTHYAVALRYEPGETAAPQCVAKGLDSLALRIREEAESHNVPIVENPPLARALYASVEIDETIPRQHYEAVAKVIGFVMQAKKRRQTRRPTPGSPQGRAAAGAPRKASAGAR
jgi:flagellar biosynthetic protein FlhB